MGMRAGVEGLERERYFPMLNCRCSVNTKGVCKSVDGI